MVTYTSTISPSSAAVTSAPESLLVRYVKAHIRQGDKAKERADQAREKSEQHYVAAGRYLTTLKVTYAPSWQAWENILKVKVKLSTGRASELMQLADGRKDLQQIRDATAQRVKALRASRSSSLQAECNEEEVANDILGQEEIATTPVEARSAPDPQASDSKAKAERMIDALAQSNTNSRAAAAEALINGSHQTRFKSVTTAVADLYARLARAGR